MLQCWTFFVRSRMELSKRVNDEVWSIPIMWPAPHCKTMVGTASGILPFGKDASLISVESQPGTEHFIFLFLLRVWAGVKIYRPGLESLDDNCWPCGCSRQVGNSKLSF